jgi:hypothetical protein
VRDNFITTRSMRFWIITKAYHPEATRRWTKMRQAARRRSWSADPEAQD